MIRTLLAIMLVLALTSGATAKRTSPPAAIAQPSGEQQWTVSDKSVMLVPARVMLPLHAGAATAVRHDELSLPGQWVDNVLRYRSSDGELIGSVYITYQGLPHTGLAMLAAEKPIMEGPQTSVERVATGIVDAGKEKQAAIRVDYADRRNGRVTSLAFIKAGRWIIKIRFSTTEARRAEVEAALSAVLEQIQIGPANPVHKAAPINVTECAPGLGNVSANLLPDPAGAELAAHALLATFDGGGIEAKDDKGERADLPSRVPDELCRSPSGWGIPIYRAAPGPERSIDGRTMLVAIVHDGGRMFEVVHAKNLGRYELLLHDAGATYLLGGFDGVPSDAQIIGIINYANSVAATVRVPVIFRPGKGPAMYLPSLRQEPAGRPAPN